MTVDDRNSASDADFSNSFINLPYARMETHLVYSALSCSYRVLVSQRDCSLSMVFKKLFQHRIRHFLSVGPKHTSALSAQILNKLLHNSHVYAHV